MIQKRKLATMSVTVLTIAALLAGCGANQSATKAPVAVNTYKVVAADTPVKAEYSGTVTATDKVPVRPKISGRVVEKYVQGGQEVTEGQPLFRLDSRTYDAALAQAKATQAQSEANLANQQLNLRRYQTLARKRLRSSSRLSSKPMQPRSTLLRITSTIPLSMLRSAAN